MRTQKEREAGRVNGLAAIRLSPMSTVESLTPSLVHVAPGASKKPIRLKILSGAPDEAGSEKVYGQGSGPRMWGMRVSGCFMCSVYGELSEWSVFHATSLLEEKA